MGFGRDGIGPLCQTPGALGASSGRGWCDLGVDGARVAEPLRVGPGAAGDAALLLDGFGRGRSDRRAGNFAVLYGLVMGGGTGLISLGGVCRVTHLHGGKPFWGFSGAAELSG